MLLSRSLAVNASRWVKVSAGGEHRLTESVSHDGETRLHLTPHGWRMPGAARELGA